MGISVEVLPDAGAPQVGVTVDGLGAGASTVTVERSWDAGATWHGVRGAEREQVVGGSGFFRDHVPPLNVATVYRVSGAVMAPDVAYSWTGAAGASTSVAKAPSGTVLRTNYATTPQPQVAGTFRWATGTGQVTTTAVVTGATDGPFPWVTSYERRTITTPKTGGTDGFFKYDAAPIAGTAGSTWSVVVYMRPSENVNLRMVASGRDGVAADQVVGATTTPQFVVPGGRWTAINALPLTLTADAAQMGWWATIQASSILPAGATVDVTAILVEQGSTPGDPFDGSTPAVPATTQTTITVPSDTAWLQDPLDPRSAIPLVPRLHAGAIQILSATAAEITRTQAADLITVQGARLPVASVGTRQGPSGVAVALRAVAASQSVLIRRLRTLFDQAGQLVLRGLPADLPIDPVAHVIAPDLVEIAVTGGQIGLWNDWRLTVTQARPSSLRIVVPWWTYDQVKALWAASATTTYDAAKGTRPGDTYLAWVRDPTVP